MYSGDTTEYRKLQGTGKPVPLLLLTKVMPRCSCCVGRSALAHLVSAAPEVDTVLVYEVAADPADIYDVLIRCQYRHRIDLLGWLIIQSASRSLFDRSSYISKVEFLLRDDVDRYRV